ncbi:MAG: DNA (cytosine-5-)-methyltransferase [Clostridiaceae bacterium]|nr:DNA (cytosine-5-)-methyltransferase [Clostridiaceae bacterium]MDY4222224.1 DNA (cytosine-5-)-methyltransferase [Candidatus Faecousia sp.]
MDKTVCELFAGVGGFRLGLEKASPDWNTVWFSQWEPGKTKQWAHDCYVSHFGDVDENTGIDIAKVNKEDIPDHNLLVGGFPCQDYSVAHPLSSSEGLEGKKGVLWWQIRDTLIAKKAPFCLFENVDRLVKSPASQRGRDFGVILACLADLDYTVEWRIINAAEYGAGQRRRRIFIFAYKNTTQYSAEQKQMSAEEIIGKSGFFAKAFPISQEFKVTQRDFDYSDIPTVSDTFAFRFENAGYMANGVIYTAKVDAIAEKPITMGQMAQSFVDEKYYLGADLAKWVYLKGSKKINRVSKTGHEYTFSEGAIAFPDGLDVPARTMLTSESSLNRSTHVIADPGTGRLRILTPVEAERIQGFDDEWTNTGMPEKFRYFCMGNALVVPLITRMGKELDVIFEKE